MPNMLRTWLNSLPYRHAQYGTFPEVTFVSVQKFLIKLILSLNRDTSKQDTRFCYNTLVSAKKSNSHHYTGALFVRLKVHFYNTYVNKAKSCAWFRRNFSIANFWRTVCLQDLLHNFPNHKMDTSCPTYQTPSGYLRAFFPTLYFCPTKFTKTCNQNTGQNNKNSSRLSFSSYGWAGITSSAKCVMYDRVRFAHEWDYSLRHHVQIGSGTHPASNIRCRWLLPMDKAARTWS
jgi:hypothetical protein